MTADNVHSFTNPPVRREIRPDFPHTLSVFDTQQISKVLEYELAKYGTSLKEVGHITLAYPHKHPELYPGHVDPAKGALYLFLDMVKATTDMSTIDWLVADGLVETRRLGRSENQTSLYALMVHQEYDIHMPSQKTRFPLLEGKGENEFFVILEDEVEQAATVRDLMSAIEHNGGTVLAVVEEGGGSKNIAQATQRNSSPKLSSRFSDATRNTGRMEELATTLSDRAKQEGFNLNPEECLKLFENGLNNNGHSVYAMTDRECVKLIYAIAGGVYSFSTLLKELGVELPPANKPRTSKTPAPTA